MKLYYSLDPLLNFGDDLNPWLWKKIFPNLFDEDEDTIFVGIGTILNKNIPVKGKKIVFGAGYGYGDPPCIDSNWEIVFVRGPLTARKLNLDVIYSITDPAILINEVFPFSDIKKTNKIAFIPHCLSCDLGAWKEVCDIADILYISPRQPVEEFMKMLASSRLVLAEAMHGAIAADAFRIPWIPIVSHNHILDFKWRDWCASLNIEYRPEQLNPVYKGNVDNLLTSKFKNNIKKVIKKLGIWQNTWSEPRSSNKELNDVAKKLISIAHNCNPILSQDLIFKKKLDEINKKINIFVESHKCK